MNGTKHAVRTAFVLFDMRNVTAVIIGPQTDGKQICEREICQREIQYSVCTKQCEGGMTKNEHK